MQQKKKSNWKKEKHHPFNADASTSCEKSSAIDFTGRENLCSMRKLVSKAIHCDPPCWDQSINAKNWTLFYLYQTHPSKEEFLSVRV